MTKEQIKEQINLLIDMAYLQGGVDVAKQIDENPKKFKELLERDKNAWWRNRPSDWGFKWWKKDSRTPSRKNQWRQGEMGVGMKIESLKQELSHKMVISGYEIIYALAKNKKERQEVLYDMKKYYKELRGLETKWPATNADNQSPKNLY